MLAIPLQPEHFMTTLQTSNQENSLTITNADRGAGNDEKQYDERHMPPLIKHTSIRMTAPMFARLTVRALVERNSEGFILRRWLTKGAAAEGIDLHEPL